MAGPPYGPMGAHDELALLAGKLAGSVSNHFPRQLRDRGWEQPRGWSRARKVWCILTVRFFFFFGEGEPGM